jgi:N-acyl-D-aspartate/D-glutamate deacylase
MFTRVEAVPRDHVLPLLKEVKDWDSAAAYRRHLDGLALGPNVTTFLGHSDLRTSVMGLSRAVTDGEKPTRAERERMTELLEESLDAGFIGLSVSANKWDKLDGFRERSKPVPSSFATFGEIHGLAKILRRRERVMQAIPNISTKVNVLYFLLESAGLFRKPLKASVLSLMDVRGQRFVYKLVSRIGRFFNRVLRADVRWQALPVCFEMYADGLDLPVFEEFGAGTAALHLADMAERSDLLRDPEYRTWFRKQWTSKFLPRVFHRDFNCSKIVGCPDASVVGRSFAEVAEERGQHVVDTFLDLAAEHGDQLRWYTIIGNDRPHAVERILSHPDIMVGFSDAGAHLRNMAFYNMQLRMLKLAKESGFMSVERAVERCTGELARWLDLDAGHVEKGSRADVVIVNPDGLDESLERIEEIPMEAFGGYRRMARRNDAAVDAVLVGGRVAVRNGVPLPAVGRERFGRFLGAGERGDVDGLGVMPIAAE